MANKLELTWYGKDEPIKVEPRLLIENAALSNTQHDMDTPNKLIHGDNLLALKALETQYAGQIKCIYIDPPYNTGAAFEHYDDNMEHSIWLNLMRARLEILKNLLAKDGCIFIQIDDSEQAYLKVLCDEIFGRRNFVTTICIKMSTASGVKTSHREKNIIKEKEMVLVFCRNKEECRFYPQYVPATEWDNEFQYFLERNDSDNPDLWEVRRLRDVLTEKNLSFDMKDKATLQFINENKNNIWRRAFIRNEFKEISQNNPDKIFVSETDKKHYYYRGREMFFLSDKYHLCLCEDGYKIEMSNLVGDFWTDINTGKLFSEGDIEFRNSKKPEFLIARILELCTKENDLVLDSFLGSGTTAAVAHKMGRHWIGIEMGEHAYTHCKVRLDKVIAGEENGGITKAMGWKGGGGYRFYELAPSLINRDVFGEYVINKEYDADMLSAAIALHEGFTYRPDPNVFWKQSVGNEGSYLFVTTRHITAAYLDSIKDTMGDGEYLIVVCRSFDADADKAYPNITVKKIPQMLLSRCEFGKDNYNLNIMYPPEYEESEREEEE